MTIPVRFSPLETPLKGNSPLHMETVSTLAYLYSAVPKDLQQHNVVGEELCIVTVNITFYHKQEGSEGRDSLPDIPSFFSG